MLLFALLAPLALAPQILQAANFTLSGRVTDQSSNAVVGATVAALDGSNATIASATTDSSGNYSMSLPGGTYTIQVTPPSGSGFQTSNTPNESITANTTLNFVLADSGSITVSGQVTDSLGNGAAGQHVVFNSFTATTDSTGAYSLQLAPGNYSVEVYGNGGGTLPGNYFLETSQPVSLTQSTTLNLMVPARQVSVHVQAPDGTPVAGVSVTTNNPGVSSLTLAGEPANFGGSYYNPNGPATDALGNATLWLLPPGGSGYTFTAAPPAGTPFATLSLEPPRVS
ncbi:MAG TPA: carboxypeptidase-like regulatory domain-containing protein [Dehalococcoidia bacterium]|nr:carboxypeptidase-like regulatory domain-containing protein [Dehalococcoidia bacterium]